MNPTTPAPSRARDAFAAALASALQWRLLLIWMLGLLLPATVIALPLRGLLGALLDFSPHAPEIARRFDLVAMSDVGAALGHGGATALGGAAMVAMLLTFALSPFLSGMTIAALRAERPLGVVALVQGGAAWYGRMFRMLLLSLVPLAVVGGVATLALRLAKKSAEHAVLESHADRGSHLAMLLIAIVFVLVHATLEAGRAELASDETLRSGWRAWLRGLARTRRRPLAVLGLYLGPTLVAFALAALLLLVRVRVTPTGAGWLVAFVVSQLAVVAIGWGRASRLFALALHRAGTVK